jgi:Leucine-rich repeat (LRR) protein
MTPKQHGASQFRSSATSRSCGTESGVIVEAVPKEKAWPSSAIATTTATSEVLTEARMVRTSEDDESDVPVRRPKQPPTAAAVLVVEATNVDRVEKEQRRRAFILLFLFLALVSGIVLGLAVPRGDDPLPSTEGATSSTSPSNASFNTTMEEFAQRFLPNNALELWTKHPHWASSRALTWLQQDMTQRPSSLEQTLQRYALAVFYYATNGDYWRNSTGWLTSTSECLWANRATAGSNCDGDETVVTSLVLNGNNLTGTLPRELKHLSLLSFDVSNNPLTGPVPSAVWGWHNAVLWKVADTNLSGRLNLTLLTDLENLDLSESQFSGTIPTQVGQLRNLANLWAFGNDLTGPIPTQVGLCTDLIQFAAYDNRLTGGIPTELAQVHQLEWLSLETNDLDGSIPTQLSQLQSIMYLSLADNQFTGTIPSQLGQITSVVELSLAKNLLTGMVPTQLGLLSLLYRLNLSDNTNMTGPIPTELGLLGELEELFLHGTRVSGTIPTEL